MALTFPDAAAEVMEHLCEHAAHGYSQPNRQGVGTGGTAGETITLSDGTQVGIAYGDRDCSSAVIECFKALGVAVGGATYTGDMRSCMVGSGNFCALPASSWRSPQRGDVLLNEGKHTAMALGGGKLGEFLRSENHSTHGAVGDQDGGESVIRALYDDDWDVVLRYCGPAREGSQAGGGAPGGSALMERVSGNTYRVADAGGVNIRKAPSTSAAITRLLACGEERTFDGWTGEADGYVWMRFVNTEGYYRYMAVRRAESGSGPTMAAGRWYAVDAYGVNIRKGPSTSAAISGCVAWGDHRDLDGWSTEADGYLWGRFANDAGYWRYVAVGSLDGSQTLMRM